MQADPQRVHKAQVPCSMASFEVSTLGRGQYDGHLLQLLFRSLALPVGGDVAWLRQYPGSQSDCHAGTAYGSIPRHTIQADLFFCCVVCTVLLQAGVLHLRRRAVPAFVDGPTRHLGDPATDATVADMSAGVGDLLGWHVAHGNKVGWSAGSTAGPVESDTRADCVPGADVYRCGRPCMLACFSSSHVFVPLFVLHAAWPHTTKCMHATLKGVKCL